MITKMIELLLTNEEIASPEDIEIILRVKNNEDYCDYTITYPKNKDHE